MPLLATTILFLMRTTTETSNATVTRTPILSTTLKLLLMFIASSARTQLLTALSAMLTRTKKLSASTVKKDSTKTKTETASFHPAENSTQTTNVLLVTREKISLFSSSLKHALLNARPPMNRSLKHLVNTIVDQLSIQT